MLECSAEDIAQSLKKAPNINAAIKNFLKREVKKGDPAEKFAKSLRSAISSPGDGVALKFVEDSLPKFQNHLYSVACYAYYEFVSELAGSVVEKYADDFNATFEINEGQLKYKDEGKFKTISDKALEILRKGLNDAGFGGSPFMKNVTMISIFERPVIDVLAPKL